MHGIQWHSLSLWLAQHGARCLLGSWGSLVDALAMVAQALWMTSRCCFAMRRGIEMKWRKGFGKK